MSAAPAAGCGPVRCAGTAAGVSVAVSVLVLWGLGRSGSFGGPLPAGLVMFVLGPALLAALLASGAWLAEPPPGRRGRGWSRLLAGISVVLSAAVLLYGGPPAVVALWQLLTGRA
jgi:hypothetical protein